jgi:hypothetical protein
MSRPEQAFNAEDAEVSAEERRGGIALRPWQEPLRPLRLMGRVRGLVAVWPRSGFAVLSPKIVASGEAIPGARTAESASYGHQVWNPRTRQSALLWLRLRRFAPGR